MKKLKVQDLIAVGIYTAIYFLLMSVCLLILRFVIPGFHNLFIPAVTALFSGIIYLILLNKVPKFGAITIMGTVVGLFFLISGHFPLAFLPNMICALAADLIQYKTKLKGNVRVLASYIVFSFGLMGPILPLWFMKNAYLKEVNQILRKKVRDPRVQDVTITDVRVTGDLQQATIFYSTLTDLASDKQKAQAGLEKATGLVRRELGQALTLYKVPEIQFELDESVQYGNKIDEMIRSLHSEE